MSRPARTWGTGAGSGSGTGLQIKTGSYTGDGNATQAVAGVGFQPKFLIIYKREPTSTDGGPYNAINQTHAYKTDQDGLNAMYYYAGDTQRYSTDDVISLDADGFTVGDGTIIGLNVFNVNGTDYTYIAFR